MIDIEGAEIVDFDCNVDKDTPTLTRNIELEVNKFATITGSRTFVPVSLVEHDYYLLSGKERIHDLRFRYGIDERDEISIAIPEGFEIESKPDSNYEIDTKYGKYTFELSVDKNQIKINRNLKVNKGQYPANEYDEVKEFMKMVRKMDGAKIVLKKKA